MLPYRGVISTFDYNLQKEEYILIYLMQDCFHE